MWTGEWWNRNVVDVESDALLAGRLPAQSDAFTVNGKTGLLYPCASTYASRHRSKNYVLVNCGGNTSNWTQ